jgi:acyl dehydratase
MVSQALTDVRIEGRRVSYTRDQARLYALSLGFGRDPMNESELDFVVDRDGFKAVPTMAAVFGEVIVDLTLACDLARPELALHGAQRLELFGLLPAAAELEVSGSISEVWDRGPERGAEIHMVAEATPAGESRPLYRATYVTIARGDGGFGGEAPPRRSGQHGDPDREPDQLWESPIRADQALLYALNGDPNPIHTQPVIAMKAGFEQPILHGLCTYGMACRAILEQHCNYEPSKIRGFDARFSAPVYPGETLRVESWAADAGVRFQARVVERNTLVLKQGFCTTG